MELLSLYKEKTSDNNSLLFHRIKSLADSSAGKSEPAHDVHRCVRTRADAKIEPYSPLFATKARIVGQH